MADEPHGARRGARRRKSAPRIPDDTFVAQQIQKTKMLGGASQLVSRIRTKCNGT